MTFFSPWRCTIAALVATLTTATFSRSFENATSYVSANTSRDFVEPSRPREMRLTNPSTAAVAEIVQDEAIRAGVPPALALAVAHVESRLRPEAIGPRTRYGRAVGLMQVLPSTARSLGHRGSHADLRHPRTNARLGVSYLRQGIARYGNDTCRVAMFYHGGPNTRIWGRRTQTYCSLVQRAMERPVRGFVRTASSDYHFQQWFLNR
jgi:soluble lytic murein transglycosylase-like protein